uniref:DnaJ homolog subfamily C member 16 n=1 Tax=Crassostrea virginica TaxID=6565 RepID=A0A8B8EMM5_CRAVI|nr:dnaJ homolog subfamily C member 16-like [Crassostrea virginica]XP_022341165.1 dnaJ homolog subfamily C member 16-like [Crassostrea virginica]
MKMEQRLVVLLLLCIAENLGDENLYDVLGVRRTASTKEIKQAYKNQAKEWHPDKNKDPSAPDKFTKINEAYETLGDPERRSQYDKFGYTSAKEHQQQNRGGPFGHPFHGDPFEGFFHNFKFNFGGSGFKDSFVEKNDINMRVYETKILPDSHQKPYILYAYAEFCYECVNLEPVLEKLFKELESVGVGMGTFHAGRVQRLAVELRITRVPRILAVMNGRVTEFRGQKSLHSLRQFVRELFPQKLIQSINDGNVDNFLGGWEDNHIRGIFFSPKEEVSAMFLAPAFYYKSFVTFGHVNTNADDVYKILKRFNLHSGHKSLLMFNEDSQSPIASLSMQQMSRSTIDEVIEANKFLLLPRISSQSYFEHLCPAELKAKRKKLCVVLVSKKTDENERKKFRRYLRKSIFFNHERVRFTYIYEETQANVIETLNKNEDVDKDRTTKNVVIIWRVERNHLSYEWLNNALKKEEDIYNLKEELEERLHKLLNSDESLAYKTILPEFHNEHALHLLIRILHRFQHWGERVWIFATSMDPITVLTVFMAFAMVFGMGYFMSTMAAIEEEQLRERQPRQFRPRPPSRTPDQKHVNLYELTPDTYDTLVLHSDAGLTMVVLINEESGNKLLNKYKDIVLPLTRYSGLTFAFLRLESYIGWYQHLLEDSVGHKVCIESININNCIGTVLALNGTRKYYYIYQPKKARKWIRQNNRNMPSAIGMFDSDENSDSDQDSRVILVEELLDGLLDWFDKVFDGSQRKLRITAWPDLRAV